MGTGYLSHLIKTRKNMRKRNGYRALDRSQRPNKRALMKLKDEIMKFLRSGAYHNLSKTHKNSRKAAKKH